MAIARTTGYATQAVNAAGVTVNGQSSTNPYPNGVSVAGTGPNNTATRWRVGFHKDLGLWIADSGFGLAPLLRSVADMQKLTSAANIIPIYREPNFRLYGFPAFSSRVLEGFDTPLPVQPLHLGMNVRILTPDGGQQYIWYGYDASTGYYVPNRAQGTGAHGGSIWGELAIAGVIIAAAVVTYGAATGWFAGAAATTAGTTAAGAVAAGSAATSGITVGTVITDIGYVGTALSVGQKIDSLVSGKPSTPGAPAPQIIVPAGTVLTAPNGAQVTTQTTGAIPPGYSISPTLPNGSPQAVGNLVQPAIGVSGGGGGGQFFPPDMSPGASTTIEGPPAPAGVQPTTAGVSVIPGVSNAMLLGLLGVAFALAVVVPSKSTHRKRR